MNKEREEFNLWLKHYDGHEVKIDQLQRAFMWQAWQAAKSQAVPEGFVVLAIDDMERICRCLDDHAVYITYKASDALESIQKAMTKAKESKQSTQFNLDEFLIMEKKLKHKGGVITADLDRFIAYAEMVLEKAKAQEPK